jgi:uncharacterized protein YcfJ
MLRLTLTALTSAALLPVLSVGAEAQSYGAHSRQTAQSYEQCVREQRNRQVAGAVIGGILGAVVGAELHDDQQDRNRANRHYRGDRYGYRDRHYRGHRGNRGRHHRGRHYEEGNDGAVVAGAGLGALAGAAVAGRGDACDRYRHQGYGYGQGGYYEQSQYGYQDDYRYNGPAQYSYDTQGYGQSSGQVLVGGEDYQLNSRNYSASSVSVGGAYGSNCRDMRSGNGAIVLMCQGTDGIWRPAR